MVVIAYAPVIFTFTGIPIYTSNVFRQEVVAFHCTRVNVAEHKPLGAWLLGEKEYMYLRYA